MIKRPSGAMSARRTASIRSTSPDALVRAASLVLLLSGVFALGTAGWSWHSASVSRARAAVAAERLAEVWLRDYMEIAAERAYRNWYQILIPALAASPDQPETALTNMRSAAAPGACVCGGLRPLYVFSANADGTDVRVLPTTADSLAEQRAESHIREMQQRMSTALPDPLRLRAATGEDAHGAWLVQFVKVRLSDTRIAVFGFGVPTAGLGSEVFGPALDSLGRIYNRHKRHAESAFSLRVAHIDGRPIYESGWGDRSAHSAQMAFWDDANPVFRASLAINPDALAGMLPGGIPASPWISLSGEVLVTLVLSGIGLILLRRASETTAYRERFAASVSHELRTPLTKILLYAETLELARGDPEQRRAAVDVIAREARHLVHLIDDVLEASRERSPRPELVLTLQAVAPIVAECVRDARALAAQRSVHIILQCDDDAQASIDASALRHVVTNLLDNALRHGPPDKEVAISVERCSSQVLVRVRDQGAGIPDADRERIWRPYERLNERGAGAAGGVGLGLTIARQLARRMHASLQLLHESRDGTTFELVLQGH